MTISITKAGQSAKTSSTSPSKNYYTYTEVSLWSSKFLHQFFVAPMPRGATVISAKVKFYSNRQWPAGDTTATLKRITSKWDATKVTHNNRPSVTASGAPSVTKNAPADNTEWVFDVTADMQAVANGAVWWGWRLEVDKTSDRHFNTSKAKDFVKPVLEVEWATIPVAPIDLYPSGGRAISVAKPLLRIKYLDPTGDHQLAAMQVLIDSAADMAVPDWDSGEVPNTTGVLDLNDTSFPGISEGQIKYWKVRTKDETGVWTEYSRIESFTRVDLGVVTLVYPAAAPNDYVEEPTPIISWTFSETQVAYRVWIALADDPAIPIWDSGKITSTDTSLHPPEGVLNVLNAYYIVNVDLWDDVNRESNSTPAYARATREFQFRHVGGVTAVSNLSIAESTEGPWIRLRGERATPPDSFTIYDNNVPILVELDPANMLYEEGKYEVWIRRVAPRITHEYMMVPVVNGSVPAVNPTVEATIRPNVAWIAHADGSNAVAFMSYTADLKLAADSASKQVKDANTTILVKGALGGYQGSFTGTIASWNGISADEFEARLKAIREGSNPIVYLTWANKSIIAAIDQITWLPTPKTEEVIYRVSFDVYERFSLT